MHEADGTDTSEKPYKQPVKLQSQALSSASNIGSTTFQLGLENIRSALPAGLCEFVCSEFLPGVTLVLEGSMLGPVQCIHNAVTYAWRREAREIPSHYKLFLGSLH